MSSSRVRFKRSVKRFQKKPRNDEEEEPDIAILAKMVEKNLRLIQKATEKKKEEFEETISNSTNENVQKIQFNRVLEKMTEVELTELLQRINILLDQDDADAERKNLVEELMEGHEADDEMEEDDEDEDDLISVFSNGSVESVLNECEDFLSPDIRLRLVGRDYDTMLALYRGLYDTLTHLYTSGDEMEAGSAPAPLEAPTSTEELYQEIVSVALQIHRFWDDDSVNLEEEIQIEEEDEKDLEEGMVNDVLEILFTIDPEKHDQFENLPKTMETYEMISDFIDKFEEKVEITMTMLDELNELADEEPEEEVDEDDDDDNYTEQNPWDVKYFQKLPADFLEKVKAFCMEYDVVEFHSTGFIPEIVEKKRSLDGVARPTKHRRIDEENTMETEYDGDDEIVDEVEEEKTSSKSLMNRPFFDKVKQMYEEYLSMINPHVENEQLVGGIDEELRSIVEIRQEQKRNDLVCDQKAFEKLIREIGQDFKTDLKFEPEAFEAIQTAAEDYLIELFHDANMEAIHSQRDRIRPQDIQLARRVRGENR